MKKVIILFIASLILMAGASNSHAILRGDVTVVRGEIVKVDSKNAQVVVYDAAKDVEKVYVVEKGLENAKVGKRVMLFVRIGTNKAKSLREIKGRKKK